MMMFIQFNPTFLFSVTENQLLLAAASLFLFYWIVPASKDETVFLLSLPYDATC
jgi:hypothetical protein